MAAALTLVACGWLAGRFVVAAYHWHSAELLVQERRFEDANRHLEACLQAWPSCPEIQILAARVARLRKEPEEALRRLEIAQELAGNSERIVLEKYLLSADRGELDHVRNKLLAFLNKDDADSVAILDVLSYQEMLALRLGDASSRLDAWLVLQPRDPEPHLRRGWVHERSRDAPAAIKEYQQALDLNPERDHHQGDRVRLRLAELLLERLRPQEAFAQFEMLADRQPQNPAILLGRARCRLLLGQTEEGRGLLEDLIQRHPGNPRAHEELARALLAQGQLLEAEIHFRKALALMPRDRQTVFGLEQCLHRLGKKEEARDLQVRLDRIITDEKQMADLMTRVQRAPDDPALRQRIGEIFLRNGMADDGVLWLEAALLCDRDFAPARELLAEWWESRAAPAKAAPHRQALEGVGISKSGNRFTETK